MLSLYSDKKIKSKIESVPTATEFWHSFLKPETEYCACPFWFWNGDLDPDELVRQIELMHEKGVDAFMIHARNGLKVEYLSQDWFDRCRISIELAHRLGMHVWIYDDLNWPSGYAGGRVCDGNEEFRAQNLIVERHLIEVGELFEIPVTNDVVHITSVDVRAICNPAPDSNILFPAHDGLGGIPNSKELNFVFGAIQEFDWQNKTRLALQFPARRLLCIYRQQPTQWWGVYSKHFYSDLLNDAAVAKFIKETHEQYYSRFEQYFGNTIKGFFVDEPGLYNNFWDRNIGSIAWTGDFAQVFRLKRGYDLLANLPHIWETIDSNSVKVRHDYYKTVAELFEERFFCKLSDWCSEHNVLLTGHLELEEYLLTNTRHSGSPFNGLRRMHIPGVDRIDSVWEKIAEKLVSSVAHAYDHKRVLGESFALSGWRLDPAMMKQVVDRQYVRGVNFLNPHAFYYSIEGDLKNECPPSEFFQNPWWDHSEQIWTYIKRLSYVLSQGNHCAPLALYYPISSYWTQITPQSPSPASSEVVSPSQIQDISLPAQQIDRKFIELSMYLFNHQWDYDFIDDALIGEAAAVSENKLVVNKERFQTLIIPEIPVLNGQTAQQILKFVSDGLQVIICGAWPKLCCVDDDQLIRQWSALKPSKSGKFGCTCKEHGKGKLWQICEGFGPIAGLLDTICKPDLKLGHSCNSITYMRRSCGDHNIYFLVNESDKQVEIPVKLSGSGIVQQWYANSGCRSELVSSSQDGYLQTVLNFRPYESKLLVTSAEKVPGRSRKHVELPRTLWKLNIDGHEYELQEFTSWNRLGLPFYSGNGIYKTKINIERPTNSRIILDIGHVCSTAELFVNGIHCGAKCFEPFQFDITEAVVNGINEIKINVANTAANMFEHLELESGLFGPMALILQSNEPER